jgi:hypothetical protein
MLANFRQEIIDVSTDVGMRRLDSRNDLHDMSTFQDQRRKPHTCGITSNHVSISTEENPLAIA